MGNDRPVAALERFEAILDNRAIYEIAALVPDTDRTRGGRQRQYPTYAWLLFEALLSVYGSARQVEAELSHPLVWNFCRDKIRDRFPHGPSRWLPERPIRRHQQTGFALGRLCERIAADMARVASGCLRLPEPASHSSSCERRRSLRA
jgi:hypothetical protein